MNNLKLIFTLENTMKQKSFIVLALFLLVPFFATSCDKKSPPPPSQPANSSIVVKLPTMDWTISGEPFSIELAYTHDTRYQGMSYRDHIGNNEGMLFLFKYNNIQSFVMRNCLVDIDIVFIKEDGTIDSFTTMTKEPMGTPNSQLKPYSSSQPVKYVLELAAGTIERLGLKKGQQLNLPPRVKRVLVQ